MLICNVATALSIINHSQLTDPHRYDPDFSSQPKTTPKFIGLVNNVAPKNPVKRAQSIAAPGSATSKKAALLHWCQRMTEGHEVSYHGNATDNATDNATGICY